MKGNFVAILMSGNTEKWFNTDVEAEEYINSVICEPGCKHCRAEWGFEDENKVFAKEIIEILEKGLKKLKSRPEYFKRFDSPNGWGTYKYFVPFVEKYLKACKEYPEAIVRVDR